MRVSFAESVIEELLADGTVSPSDSVICVCAGERERDLFAHFSFEHVMLTNIDARTRDRFRPFEWSYQDAEALQFEDRSFDFAFVADGLHHCFSPHRALLEMYRVSRRGIIVVESRDNLLMRTANILGLTPDYEVEAVVGSEFKEGGVNNTEIPNHIYRWTEPDFKKAIKSYDPHGKHTFRFFHGLNLPHELATWKKNSSKSQVLRISSPLLHALTRLFKKQCNTLGMVALRPHLPRDLWPWLKIENGHIIFDKEYANHHFKELEGSGLSARPRDVG